MGDVGVQWELYSVKQSPWRRAIALLPRGSRPFTLLWCMHLASNLMSLNVTI